MTALGLGLGLGILDLVSGIWSTVKLGTGIWVKFRLGTGIWYPLPLSRPPIVGSVNDGSQSISRLNFKF